MFVITDPDAPRFRLPGIEFTGLASPSRGSADVCTWRITVEAGLRSAEYHTLDRDEIFMVTAGALRIAADGPAVSAGDAVVVPAGTPIQVENAGVGAAVAFVVIRAGFTPTMQDGTVVGVPPWAA